MTETRRSRLVHRANQLRNTGLSYTTIDRILKLPKGKAWQLCNPEAHRKNSRESHARYAARGYVALCDMED